MSAWGNSWGGAWGDSWGGASAVPPQPDDAPIGGPSRSERDRVDANNNFIIAAVLALVASGALNG